MSHQPTIWPHLETATGAALRAGDLFLVADGAQTVYGIKLPPEGDLARRSS